MKTWLFAGCVFVIITIAAGGCGGDDGNLSLEEYFERVEAAVLRAEERTAEEASKPFNGERVSRAADILTASTNPSC